MPVADDLDVVLQGASVLVVDDSAANVALLTRLLRTAGVDHVHGLTDPREAVERWRQVDADIVLLDLQMPYMDGFAVLQALRAAAGDGQILPVLVLTADTAATTRDRALGAGASDFLTKPFDRTEVLLRVRNLLQTRRLYELVQERNRELRAELDRRAREERRQAAEKREALARIDTVLSRGLLGMVFQPIVDLTTGDAVGLEGLARFACEPVRSPDVWFAEAAQMGRGAELELAALEAGLQQVGDLPPGTFMSLNTSAATAMLPELFELLDRWPGDRVVLELTEHTQVEDYEALLGALSDLRRCGVRIAVDDTGAGYAGLRHLLHVRPDIVKLDVALTTGVDRDPARRALAAGLVIFAREIGASIVAEGIETAEELETLRSLSIRWGQGYHLGRPARLAPAGTVQR